MTQKKKDKFLKLAIIVVNKDYYNKRNWSFIDCEGILVITRLIGVPRSRSFELEHDL